MNKSTLRNQTFQFLEALAILMVIDDHMSTRIGFLSSVFPYNSFYMPMFVFISGYFFRQKDVLPAIGHKVRKLLIPYVIWCVLGNFTALIMEKMGIAYWYTPFSFRSILSLFFGGPLSSINGAAWFVIMLFWVSVIYIILSRILRFRNSKTVDYIILGLLLIAGFVSLRLCMAGYPAKSPFYLFILRTVFYLQFYHMGNMFKLYWEAHVQKVHASIRIGLSLLINVVLICFFGDSINYYATSGMGGFNSWYLPLVTSITGFIFWYTVMSFVSEKIGAIKFIDFLAENTFTIMASHLFFVNLPNIYVFLRIKAGDLRFPDFDIAAFQSGAWYRYSPNARLIGFFMGLAGSLLLAFVIRAIKKKWSSRRKSQTV